MVASPYVIRRVTRGAADGTRPGRERPAPVPVIDGALARIDVGGGRWRTVGGARVGSLEMEIRTIFKNRVEVKPHTYDPRGHVLLVRGKVHALAFETDGDIVTGLRAGIRETLLG